MSFLCNYTVERSRVMERRKRRRGVHPWEGSGEMFTFPGISSSNISPEGEGEERRGRGKKKIRRGGEVYLWHHSKSPMMSRSMPTAAMAVQWVLVSQQVSERFPNTCHHHCHTSCHYELVDAVRAIHEVNVRHKMSC